MDAFQETPKCAKNDNIFFSLQCQTWFHTSSSSRVEELSEPNLPVETRESLKAAEFENDKNTPRIRRWHLISSTFDGIFEAQLYEHGTISYS